MYNTIVCAIVVVMLASTVVVANARRAIQGMHEGLSSDGRNGEHCTGGPLAGCGKKYLITRE
jgi:hypothetical protein